MTSQQKHGWKGERHSSLGGHPTLRGESVGTQSATGLLTVSNGSKSDVSAFWLARKNREVLLDGEMP